MTARRLCVVTHESNRQFWKSRYLGRHLAGHWRKHGVEVLLAHGVDEAVDADIGLLHVDATRVEPGYSACMERFPVAINARVVDISKRRFSRQLLSRGDAFDGRVVVKTNNNFGGITDLGIDVRKGRSSERSAAGDGPWRSRSVITPSQYPIFDSLRDVPPGVWRNPHLIVEKLLTEQDADGNYRLRFWFFFGDRELGELCTGTKPIVKGRSIFRREVLHGVPDELRQLRSELGFDFGKFDYAIVEGKPVLYDINPTPTFGPRRVSLFSEQGVAEFARGLDAF